MLAYQYTIGIAASNPYHNFYQLGKRFNQRFLRNYFVFTRSTVTEYCGTV